MVANRVKERTLYLVTDSVLVFFWYRGPNRLPLYYIVPCARGQVALTRVPYVRVRNLGIRVFVGEERACCFDEGLFFGRQLPVCFPRDAD